MLDIKLIKENNEATYQLLAKPEFDFKEKDHVKLEKDLNLVDY